MISEQNVHSFKIFVIFIVTFRPRDSTVACKLTTLRLSGYISHLS